MFYVGYEGPAEPTNKPSVWRWVIAGVTQIAIIVGARMRLGEPGKVIMPHDAQQPVELAGTVDESPVVVRQFAERIPSEEQHVLILSVFRAVELAEAGSPEAGAGILEAGLQAAEEAHQAGMPWGLDLWRWYRGTLDNFRGAYGL